MEINNLTPLSSTGLTPPIQETQSIERLERQNKDAAQAQLTLDDHRAKDAYDVQISKEAQEKQRQEERCEAIYQEKETLKARALEAQLELQQRITPPKSPQDPVGANETSQIVNIVA